MIMEIKTCKSIKIVVNDDGVWFNYMICDDDDVFSVTYSDRLDDPIYFPLGNKESAKAVAKAILKICE
jgi:hypothetical protein